jgi:hypothetical protein
MIGFPLKHICIKNKQIRKLAEEANIDIDEALVTLWDAGFNEINRPEDLIGPIHANRIRRILGIATRREFKSIAYWKDVTLFLYRA